MAMSDLEKEVLKKIQNAKTGAEIHQAVMLLPSGDEERLTPQDGQSSSITDPPILHCNACTTSQNSTRGQRHEHGNQEPIGAPGATGRYR